MRRRASKPATYVVPAAVLLLLAAGVASPARAAGDGPLYVERLDLPVAADSISSPRSVTADLHTGEVFVADLHRDRIVIFGPDGAFRYQIRGGDIFRAPRDVAVDPEGYLYLTANRGTEDVLLKLDFDGLPVGEIELSGLAAASGLEWPVAGGSAMAGAAPDGGADLDSAAADGPGAGDGADEGDGTVDRPGAGDGTGVDGDDGADEEYGADGGGPAVLQPPGIVSLALSPAGDRLYLLDAANQRLWLADTGGRVTASVDLTEGLSPNRARDLRVGHVDVYGDQVLVAMASLGEIHIWDLDLGNHRHVGFHGTAPCQLGFPVAAARDAGGDYLVIDQQRMLVLRWSPVGNRCVGEWWGLGSNPGYFYFPFDLALGPGRQSDGDGLGDLYVSQGYEGRVQAYTVERPAAMPAPEEDGQDDADGGGGGDTAGEPDAR